MSDLDQLLGSGLSHAAGDAAVVREFDAIRTRGRRRRLRHSLATATAGAALVAGGAVAWSTVPGPTGEARPASPTPAEIVDSPGSTPLPPQVAPENPRVRAVTWMQPDDGGLVQGFAVAVTDDGFETRATVEVDGPVRYVGNGVFAEEDDGVTPRLIHADGRTVEVHVRPLPAGQESVLPGAGQVVVKTSPDPATFASVDPVTGRGYEIGVPAGLDEIEVDAVGTLRGIAHGWRRSYYVWSDNGGASWHETLLRGDKGDMHQLATSGGSEIVVLEGVPREPSWDLRRVERSTDGGRTFTVESVRADQLDSAAVLPDGRIIANLRRQQAPAPYFLDETGAHPADLDMPASVDAESSVGFLPTAQGAALYVGGYRSDDGGKTWQPFDQR